MLSKFNERSKFLKTSVPKLYSLVLSISSPKNYTAENCILAFLPLMYIL